MFCTNCGAGMAEGALFCTKCGTKVIGGNTSVADKPHPNLGSGSPAVSIVKTEFDLLVKGIESFWNRLSLGEKISGVGAAAASLSFFLPFYGAMGQSISGLKLAGMSGYVMLVPVLSVVSLVILFYGQGKSDTRKALLARWQILVGTVLSTVSLSVIMVSGGVIGGVSGFVSGFGGNLGAGVGVGLYLLAVGSVAIIVGAFKEQSRLIAK